MAGLLEILRDDFLNVVQDQVGFVAVARWKLEVIAIVMGISTADTVGGQRRRHYWDPAGTEQPDCLLDLLDAAVESHDAEQPRVPGGQRDDHPGDGDGVPHLRAAVGYDHLEHRARPPERILLGDHQAF